MSERKDNEASEVLKRRVFNIRQGVSQIPYFQNLPCKIDDVDEGWVRVTFDIEEHLCNYRGIAAGGVLAAFCDTLMGMASRSLGYIRPVHPGQKIVGVGQVVHHGGRTIVAECELMDEENKVVVKGRSSFYILRKYDD